MKRNIHILNKIILLALCLVFTSCASWFQGKVDMDNNSTSTDLANLFSYDSEKIKLKCPQQILISQGVYSDKIKISWQEVEEATFYSIERACVAQNENGIYEIPDEENFELLSEYVYDSKYEDKILEEAEYTAKEYSYIYYYRVKANNIGKAYESSDYTPIKEYGYLYKMPLNVSADKGKSTSEINIYWDSAEDVLKYNIYRGKDTKVLTLIKSVDGSKTKYTDNDISDSEQGVEFYYTVEAVNSYGMASTKSAFAMGYSLKQGAPAAPSNVQVVDGLGTNTKYLEIKWDAVSAESSRTVTYNLYRSSSEDSTTNLIKANYKATSYKDSSGLKTGVYYYYYVMTVTSDEEDPDNEEKILKSGFSDSGPASTSPAYGFLLSPPTVLKVEEEGVTEGNVLLKWKPALGYDLMEAGKEYYYNVYQSSSLTTTFSLLKQNVESIYNSDGYICTEVAKCNYYKISTLNSQNTESTLSTAAAPHPAAPLNVKASKNKNLTSYTPNENNVYPVEITWDPPENESPTAYRVYRSTSPDSGFKKVDTVTTTYCIDTNASAKPEVFYYYKVISLNLNYEGSHSNDPASDTAFNCRGYGAITRDQWFREYNKSIMHSQSKLTLMHKSSDTDKLGTETIKGDIRGSLTYKSSIKGFGAEIKMPYTDYSDFYCGDGGKLYIGSVNGHSKSDAYSLLSDEEKSRCVEFMILNGSTDTSCNMSANGNMSNSVSCKGMYPGKAVYDNLEIVSGAAGRGYYVVTTFDLDGNIILPEGNVSWEIGEEDTGYNYGK